jgi:hypothetical protein
MGRKIKHVTNDSCQLEMSFHCVRSQDVGSLLSEKDEGCAEDTGNTWEYMLDTGNTWEYILDTGNTWEYMLDTGNTWEYILDTGNTW